MFMRTPDRLLPRELPPTVPLDNEPRRIQAAAVLPKFQEIQRLRALLMAPNQHFPERVVVLEYIAPQS